MHSIYTDATIFFKNSLKSRNKKCNEITLIRIFQENVLKTCTHETKSILICQTFLELTLLHAPPFDFSICVCGSVSMYGDIRFELKIPWNCTNQNLILNWADTEKKIDQSSQKTCNYYNRQCFYGIITKLSSHISIHSK